MGNRQRVEASFFIGGDTHRELGEGIEVKMDLWTRSFNFPISVRKRITQEEYNQGVVNITVDDIVESICNQHIEDKDAACAVRLLSIISYILNLNDSDVYKNVSHGLDWSEKRRKEINEKLYRHSQRVLRRSTRYLRKFRPQIKSKGNVCQRKTRLPVQNYRARR